MNMTIFRFINNMAGKNHALDLTMIFFSKYVPYIFMLAIVFVFITGIKNNSLNYRKAAISTLIITIINLIINFIIGGIYYVDRPFVHNKVNLLFPHVKDASFPSDHAAGTMSIALGLKGYSKAFRIIFIVLSFIVGFSRVYVGQHYPSDVIGAYIIVFVSTYIYNFKLKDKVEELYGKIESKLMVSFGSKLLEKIRNS
ncbi:MULTISPECIES: phosphatase PAP2 family protein [Clostridium]|uniref:phosphatase PAP2 family protein n=1 Tax=Clostridium TaxID=1485 RepID=UPI00069F03C6|nr:MULTISPECIES: phosphatase PAP2 family protein [Clostridium]KOF57501.1 phosphatase [Clostridium sp. DMHC 10]MCD2345894.1 phosphatase PAP2 family protein [Clostridium guangxiense]